MTFQEAEHTGVVKGQQFLAFVISDQGRNAARELPPLLNNPTDAVLAERLNSCRQPRDQREFLSGATIGAVITKAGTLLYDSVFNEIEAKRKRLEAASKKDYEARLSWSTRGYQTWDDVTCVVLTRLTDTDLNGQPDDIGFIAVLWRDSLGSGASQFKPIYVRLNNAVAITGSSDEPSLQLDIVMTVKSFADNQIKELAAIKLPPIQAAVGKDTQVCTAVAEGGGIRPVIDCPLATEMFVNPAAKSEALQIAVKVVESGSGVPDKERVEAGDKALKELTKPIFDDVLKQIADAAKRRS
ncbi:MAG: hypothetical protein HC850_11195 [Rhodomicrobium sp.]|nr:hypothetical protein [Rhodomicrobium sp.]